MRAGRGTGRGTARKMTPAQCRAARGLLGWTAKELSTRSGISQNAITRFERGDNVHLNTVRALERTYIQAGIEFEGRIGVRLPSADDERD